MIAQIGIVALTLFSCVTTFAQEQSLKTFSGSMELPKELAVIVSPVSKYTTFPQPAKGSYSYYEVAGSKEDLGLPKRVYHGSFDVEIYRNSFPVRITGTYKDGKLDGEWSFSGIRVIAKDDYISYEGNSTVEFPHAGKEVEYKAKIRENRLVDTLHIIQRKSDYEGSKFTAEVIVPVDRYGWVHGVVIERENSYGVKTETRFEYYHGYLTKVIRLDQNTGELFRHNPIGAKELAELTNTLNAETGEFMQKGVKCIRTSSIFGRNRWSSDEAFSDVNVLEWAFLNSTATLELMDVKYVKGTKEKKTKNGIYSRSQRH